LPVPLGSNSSDAGVLSGAATATATTATTAASSFARFLGVGRSLARSALLGLASDRFGGEFAA
jgi:hypothetical protein